jgi:NAD(P)-dependent dehydrogenase (short-subunit alcohol dehydrogenase family)
MANMNGKVVLITGATNGIGKVSALELARQGAELVIVGRDPARTEATLQEIRKQSGNEKVSSLVADLSVMSEVRKLAQQFRSNHNSLHVLLNNAGAVFAKRSVTADCFEMTFALNHLSYFVLTHELLPLLKQSAPSRIVNVASRAHRRGKIDFDDLMKERRYKSFNVYSDSKLANILFTYELAKKLEGSGVTANCLHPGVVATGFGGAGGLVGAVLALGRPLMITPEEGAQTSIYLASSPEVEGVSGRYFDKKQAVPSVSESNDPAIAKRLWEVSEKLTGTGPW